MSLLTAVILVIGTLLSSAAIFALHQTSLLGWFVYVVLIITTVALALYYRKEKEIKDEEVSS